MNKTLVIGDGYIASFFAQFPEEYHICPKSHIANDSWIILSRYDTIINAYEQRNGSSRTLLIENFSFVQELYEVCRLFSKKFIQISTAELYNGSHDWENNVEETNTLQISSDYLLTKRVAERYLEATDALVLRIRNPFDGSYHEGNWLIKNLYNTKVRNVLDTHTYMPDLKRAIDILNNSTGGMYNVVQIESGSDLNYYGDVLKLPRYAHLNEDIEDHEDIDPDGFLSSADVNATKLGMLMKFENMTVAVVKSWEQLKDKIDPSLLSGKLS